MANELELRHKVSTLQQVSAALIIICLILAFLQWNGCNKSQRQLQVFNAINDSLHTYKDKYGREVSERQTIVADYKTLQDIHAKVGSDYEQLQKVVDRMTVNATLHSAVTHDTIRMPSKIVYLTGDTCNPVYEGIYNDKWASMHVFSSRDTTAIEYSINNEFVYSTKWKRKHIFARAVMMSEVRDNNPHTNTSSFLVYQVQAPRATVWTKLGYFAAGFAVADGVNRFVIGK